MTPRDENRKMHTEKIRALDLEAQKSCLKFSMGIILILIYVYCASPSHVVTGYLLLGLASQAGVDFFLGTPTIILI